MVKALALAAHDTNAVFTKSVVDIPEVGDKDVLIKVHFCGVCHSDLHQVRGEWPLPTLYPMVPGHEVVGLVEQVGKGVNKYKVGDRVGVGCMVDSCRSCEECKNGTEQYCAQGCIPTYNGKKSGKLTFGGYAEKIVVDQDFVLRIPDGMDLAQAGPLLCAGITTYSPLVFFGAKKSGASWHVGVQGFGGLGHMAVKLAKTMGCKVTVISRGTAKKAAAEALGASYIDSNDSVAMNAAKKTLNLVISTVSGEYKKWHEVLGLLKINSALVLVGVPPKAISLEPFAVIGARRIFAGSNIGGIPETQEMLEFCAQHKVFPDIELVDAKKINWVHASLFEGQGDVRRFVLKIGETLNQSSPEVETDPRSSKQSWSVRGFVEPPEANKHKKIESAGARTPKEKSYVAKALFCIALTAAAVGGGFLLGKRSKSN